MARPDRPPGLDTTSGPALTPPGRPDRASTESVGRSLPCDQIDPARLVIGDATGRLDDQLGVLSVALAMWISRDDSRPQPEVRHAAYTAMDAIDSMLRELHGLRSRLVGEIRVSDDLAADRAPGTIQRKNND